MSLCDVLIGESEALLASDSEAITPEGQRGSVSKSFALPHFGAVICGRGQAGFLQAVYGAANLTPAGSFDELADNLPAQLAATFGSLVPNLRALLKHDVPELVAEQQVVLVGWSESLDRIRGVLFQQETREAGFIAHEIEGLMAAPYDDRLEGLRDALLGAGAVGSPAASRAMKQLARAQVQLARETDPALPCGGRLVLTYLSKGRIEIDAGAFLTPSPVVLAGASASMRTRFSSQVTEV